MRLSRIKLAGFKSFVDAATVELPGNIIGIVGPNGCGKSNIIDAVRWVMGESSARNLRGTTMTDVIFNGSSVRQPVGQASIELVFDNTDQSVVGQFAAFNEISVRRVVGRDGHSDYFLNGTRCRRKDITDLFLGTGIGPRSYAIIEQGMISSLIEARPEELRVYIEEAAGVSKYKERRQETAQRLQSTAENLSRLSDLRDEIGRQLDRLKRQARQAERYTEYKQQAKIARGALEFRRCEALNQQQADVEQRIEVFSLRIEELTARQQAAETRSIKAHEENHTRLAELKEKQQQQYQLGTGIARLEQAIDYHRQQQQSLKEQIERHRQALTQLAQQIARKEQEKNLFGPQLETVIRQRTDNATATAQWQAQCDNLDALLLAWTQAQDEFIRQSGEPLAQIKTEQARIEQFEQQMKLAEKQHARLVQEKTELDSAGLVTEIETLRQQEVSERRELTELEQELEQLTTQAQNQRAANHQARETHSSLRNTLQTQRGQFASLEVLQKAAITDTEKQLTQWLAKKGINDVPRLFDRLSVQPGWETAVETVLGHLLNGVLLEDAACLYPDLHQRQQLQQAGGVLLESSLDVQLESTAEGIPLKPLSHYIDHPLVGQLLCAGVYCADNLDEALINRPLLLAGESIVLPDGFRLGAGWAGTPPGNTPASGVLQRKKELAKLAQIIATGSAEESRLAVELEQLRATLQATDQQREKHQQTIQTRHRELSQLQGRLSGRTMRLEQMNERARRVEHELQEWDSNQQLTTGALAASREKHSAARLAAIEFDTKNRERLQIRDQRTTELQAARRQLLEQTRLGHQLELDQQRLNSAATALETELKQLTLQQQQQSTALATLEAQMDQQRTGQIEQTRAELDSLLSQRVIVDAELAQVQQTMDTLSQSIQETENERHTIEKETQKQRDAIQTEKLSQHEIQIRLDTSRRELATLNNEPNQSLLEILSWFEQTPNDTDLALSEEEWNERIEVLHAKIERLGPINLAAIEEYTTQSERKLWLDQQNDDLREAIATLEDAIRKIDRETRSRFEETFEKVNLGIQRMFPRLFGGGHAYLEMIGDDLLNSGVSLMARPPGKRITNIQLMSGGEKALTAIALVFSIFELNPAPFCLLDEVDAPLDDNNNGRFNDLVREMSERVQFIVITHNKVTMEIATHLIGVTMSEPGVSRLVTVNMQEAAEILQPN